MRCYEVCHINDVSKEVKKIGYFSSLSSARSAIARLSEKPGFCEKKDSFVITQHNIAGSLPIETLYEALVYYHTNNYSFEYEIVVGIFASLQEAENAMREFKNTNSGFDAEILVEQIVNRCVIDKANWSEGYTTYTTEQ